MAKRKFDETLDANQRIRIVSAEGTLKYDFMTSLRNIVMARIITHLWMDQAIRKEIKSVFHSDVTPLEREFDNRWQEIEKKVVAKVQSCSTPNSVTRKLTNIVPIIGESIFNWIRYHDVFVFNAKFVTPYSAVDEISNIVWTARGKIDFAQTAKNILANPDSCLTYDQQYKLACTHCLEDFFDSVAPNILDSYYLDTVEINIHPMVHFWTAHYTGVPNSYYYYYYNYGEYVRSQFYNQSMNENIFQLMLMNNVVNGVNRLFNDVPIRYMWSQLTEEEKSRNIRPLLEKLGNQDLSFTLLSSLKYTQQLEVFRLSSAYILGAMFNDWLWGEYFLPTAFHALHIMSPLSFSYILTKINKEKNKNAPKDCTYVYNRYKDIFIQIWQRGSRKLKNCIFMQNNGCMLEELVLYSLSWHRDVDIIKLILNDLSAEQKRDFIFGKGVINHCIQLVESGQCDLLDLFVEFTLLDEEDIVELKSKMTNIDHSLPFLAKVYAWHPTHVDEVQDVDNP